MSNAWSYLGQRLNDGLIELRDRVQSVWTWLRNRITDDRARREAQRRKQQKQRQREILRRLRGVA